MSKPRIAVVGGGITGLAAAYELRDDADVTIFEATDRLGGMVFTDELDGLQIEWGPDSLLARDDAPVRLLTELGLADDIVEPHDFGAWIVTTGTLKRLPGASVLGIPTSPVALALSGLLSPRGVLRAAGDLVLPKTSFGADTSVGSLVRTRFGNEVAERMVAPLMAGIRAGDIDDMSLEMAAPQVAEVARHHRSLVAGLRQAARRATAPHFIGLRHGMSSLVDALTDRSNAEIRLRTPVETMDRQWSMNGEHFDGVVLAVPDHAAAKLIGDWLAQVPWQSSGVTNLVFPAGSVAPLDRGTGVLVPPRSGRSLTACTWVTKKWPHLAPPDGRIVLRCVHSPEADDRVITDELAELVDITAEPIRARTHVWTDAFPVFRVGHRDVLDTVHKTLQGQRVRVAGAGYLATGLNDCLNHGRAAAREVVADLRS